VGNRGPSERRATDAGSRPTSEYHPSNGVGVPIDGGSAAFVERFTHAVVGSVVARTDPAAASWRALTDTLELALAQEIAHLQATARPELRAAVLAYLLTACVVDAYQDLLDDVYPHWRAEALADDAQS
jgi:hypothetical protein